MSRVFVLDVPAAPPPGLLAVSRHPDRGGAEVSAAAAAWALTPRALGPRQRALSARARILVLVTAGGSEPPLAAAAAGAALPGAAAGPPPSAAAPRWPGWLPR